MADRETYSCTIPDCNKVFTRAYELKKHIVAHEKPESVFRCLHCDFITLTKKNLGIHVATHTGEKDKCCPDTVIIGGHEEPCDYRTNDPAALTRHRKKKHGHEPEPTRTRPKATSASPRKLCQEARSPRRRKPAQRIIQSPRRKATRSPRKANKPRSGSGKTAVPITLPVIRVADADGNEMNVNSEGEDVGYESGSATLIGSDDEPGLDAHVDPSLRANWMLHYEKSYTSFNMDGMMHQLADVLEGSSFDLAVVDEHTGREGCLCPEWMIDAGVEGWDASVLEAHKDYYTLHA